MMDPMLTIGLPVYNGGKMLETAINSLLRQTYRDFVLHISDNASTDDTPLICRAAVEQDKRVVWTRHSKNIGGAKNFRFVLENARTPFFMWAAHDDYWRDTFVEKNLALLINDPRATASISKVIFRQNGVQVPPPQSTYALKENESDNLHDFFRNPGGHASRLYAVHRTEALKRSFPAIAPFFAFDFLIIALTLLEGCYLEWPEVLLYREAPEQGRNDFSNVRYTSQMRTDNSWMLTRLFPLSPLTYQLIKRLPTRYLRYILMDLVRHNIICHCQYMERFHPKSFRIERTIYRWSGISALFRSTDLFG
jgi:glycosyltransferase involved in cell wall biosynthesis